MIIGLDWDDTISLYSKGIRQLIHMAANSIHVITLNTGITEVHARTILSWDGPLEVHIMPDEAFTNGGNYVEEDVAKWKADVCDNNLVQLMLDDDEYVIRECASRGIATIRVNGEHTW